MLIGENIDLPASLVTNFPISDPAASSDIAYCRWERDHSKASTALVNLRDGISEERALKIRHALSTRRRREFDQRPVEESISRLREVM